MLGDDGGLQYHIEKALENLKLQSKQHPDKDVRKLCNHAIDSLNAQSANPSSLYGDPHTFLKTIRVMQEKPDKLRLSSAVDTLNSFSPTD